jgi:cytochrome P450
MSTGPVIDLLDPVSFANGQPHDQFRWLRENDPVHHHPEADGPGFWVLTRHRDVKRVGREWSTFSSEPTVMIRDTLMTPDHQMFLMLDPPATPSSASWCRTVSPDGPLWPWKRA